MLRLAGRYREFAVALLLLGGALLFGNFVHGIYPIGEWLFWHYAVYWLSSLACATACFGLGASISLAPTGPSATSITDKITICR